ncbi:hypothetical protein C5B42_03485, partial [Candidatus Cerribacteria bacterium 'Amazon FNV 2010 28 9']
MALSHCLFTGVPTATSWTQSYVHAHDEVCFCVIVHTEGEEAATKGKHIIEVLISLTQAQNLTHDSFLHLFDSYTDESVSFVSGLCEGKDLTIFTKGTVGVWLSRETSKGMVTLGNGKGQYIQGKINDGDLYIF